MMDGKGQERVTIEWKYTRNRNFRAVLQLWAIEYRIMYVLITWSIPLKPKEQYTSKVLVVIA